MGAKYYQSFSLYSPCFISDFKHPIQKMLLRNTEQIWSKANRLSCSLCWRFWNSTTYRSDNMRDIQTISVSASLWGHQAAKDNLHNPMPHESYLLPAQYLDSQAHSAWNKDGKKVESVCFCFGHKNLCGKMNEHWAMRYCQNTGATKMELRYDQFAALASVLGTSWLSFEIKFANELLDTS